MLTAIPQRWFSWNFTLFDRGEPIAEIDISSWREKGGLTVSNATYLVYRERLFSGAFVLESNGKILARAGKPSALTRRMVLDIGNTQFELKPRSVFSRGFQLLAGKVVVGTLSPVGILSRRMNIELPADLSLPVRAFVVWLTLLLWKRAAEAAAAS